MATKNAVFLWDFADSGAQNTLEIPAVSVISCNQMSMQELSDVSFSTRSGVLRAERLGSLFQLDFPINSEEACESPTDLLESLNVTPRHVGLNKFDYFVMDDDTLKVLFDFRGADATKEWQTVNDGVMGGVSDGKFKVGRQKDRAVQDGSRVDQSGASDEVMTRRQERRYCHKQQAKS